MNKNMKVMIAVAFGAFILLSVSTLAEKVIDGHYGNRPQQAQAEEIEDQEGAISPSDRIEVESLGRIGNATNMYDQQGFIITDKYTGSQYLMIRTKAGVSVTPLLDSKGMPFNIYTTVDDQFKG